MEPVLDSAIAKIAEAIAPPTVLVALVIPVANPVRVGGAPAGALAGRAATSAPEPTPAIAMFTRAWVVESWNGTHRAEPTATSSAESTSAPRARSHRAVTGRVNAPAARNTTYTPIRVETKPAV